MKRIVAELAAAVFMIGGVCGCTFANAQQQRDVPSISTEGHRDIHGKAVYETYFAGQISVGSDISSFRNEVFSCTPAHPLKKGDVLAAKVSEDQWSGSVDIVQLVIDTLYVDFPIMALVKHRTVVPAVVKANVNIKAGAVIHSGGYRIEVKRSVKAGDSIPAVCVGDESVLSVGIGGDADAKPWFTAFKEGTKPEDRAADMEAWQIENSHLNCFACR